MIRSGDSARVEPLQLEHLANADDSGKELPLAELKRGNSTDGRVVNVAGFKPEYDPRRGLWFCDISFDPGQTLSYFPFVRLALARFQPHSVFTDDGWTVPTSHGPCWRTMCSLHRTGGWNTTWRICRPTTGSPLPYAAQPAFGSSAPQLCW
jgi:hypothetical protein